MVFGSEVDSTSNRVPESRIIRSTTQIILDLNGYSDSVVYFEDTNVEMGYYDVDLIASTDFINTSVLTTINNETYTLSGNSDTFANGIYDISSSGNQPDRYLYNIVRKNNGGDEFSYIADFYSNPINQYYQDQYVGSESTAGYKGEWLEITMPYKLILKQLYIAGLPEFTGHGVHPYLRPKKVFMLGSNDGGTNYELITTIENTGSMYPDSHSHNSMNSITGVTKGYSTIRMVIDRPHAG